MSGRGMQQGPAVRLYQVWEGNERFFCGGRCIMGPNWRALLGTASLVLAPLILYFYFVAPVLAENYTLAVPAIAAVLGAACFLFLFKTGCMDPGILLRQEPDEEYRSGRKSKTKEVIVRGHRVLVRYNETCHFYQPPRAHHCSVNDNCIEKFDHHCPWVGTTIGRRNYRWFLLFIFSASLLCMFVCATGILSMYAEYKNLKDQKKSGDELDIWHAFEEAPAAVALAGYTALFFLFVGGLSIFHMYLVSTNQTTYENFRYSYDRTTNPYDEGCLMNCWQVWFQKSSLPAIDFRAIQNPISVYPLTETIVVSGGTTNAAAAVAPSFQPDDAVAVNMDPGMVNPRPYPTNSRVPGGASYEHTSGGSRSSSRGTSYKLPSSVIAPPSRIPSGASSRKTPQVQASDRRTRNPSINSSNHSSNSTSHDTASLSGIELQAADDTWDFRGSY